MDDDNKPILKSQCRELHNDLCHMFDRKVELQYQTIDTKIESIKEATRLQTRELDRRLDLLNGHQAELKDFQNQFVRTETYELKIKMIDEFVSKANLDLAKLMTDYNDKITRSHWIGIIAIVISVLSGLYHWLKM